MPGHVPLHVGHFFGPLVDQQQHQLDVGVIGVNPLGDVLHQDRLAGARRGNDQPALAEPNRGENVDDAGGQFGGIVLEFEHRLRVEGGDVVERGLVRRIRRGEPFDGVDLAQRPPARVAVRAKPRAEIEFADESGVAP